ncbi:luc7-like protein 3 [Neocloeon triangulifer]|uniref:luc7-like protein 3 n=1 Tax=Neocloeon triangulifer TaxID=2078957 RepID=UPI00286EC865|nr:luc7-like protein 3 [Neocloeon triangulifer]XP_059475251.1 luc7-like protein 3 [Neocloeon triangulifer]
MASLAAAALLDELMGRNRNILPDDVQNKISWDDPDICKLHLVKLCPHELFVNTRADLGPCPKIHDDEMRKEYAKQSTYRKQQYEDEFIRFCQGMLNEVERKIAKGKVRLALSGRSAEAIEAPENEKAETEEIRELTDKINGLVEEAEKSGIMGNVDEAQECMRQCDEIREQREQLRRQNGYSWTNELAQAQEKQMEVCETCGAFLIVGDAQQRIDDHLQGKQHMGYARLKEAVDEILDIRKKAKEEREKRREDERKERVRAQKAEEKLREAEREVRRMGRGGKDEEEPPRHTNRKPKQGKHRSRSRSRSPHFKGNRREAGRDHDRHEKPRHARRSPEHRRDYREERNRNDRNGGRSYKDSSRRGS